MFQLIIKYKRNNYDLTDNNQALDYIMARQGLEYAGTHYGLHLNRWQLHPVAEYISEIARHVAACLHYDQTIMAKLTTNNSFWNLSIRGRVLPDFSDNAIWYGFVREKASIPCPDKCLIGPERISKSTIENQPDEPQTPKKNSRVLFENNLIIAAITSGRQNRFHLIATHCLTDNTGIPAGTIKPPHVNLAAYLCYAGLNSIDVGGAGGTKSAHIRNASGKLIEPSAKYPHPTHQITCKHSILGHYLSSQGENIDPSVLIFSLILGDSARVFKLIPLYDFSKFSNVEILSLAALGRPFDAIQGMLANPEMLDELIGDLIMAGPVVNFLEMMRIHGLVLPAHICVTASVIGD